MLCRKSCTVWFASLTCFICSKRLQMFVIFRLATVRREKFVCSHSDIVTVGLQVAGYQLMRNVNQW